MHDGRTQQVSNVLADGANSGERPIDGHHTRAAVGRTPLRQVRPARVVVTERPRQPLELVHERGAIRPQLEQPRDQWVRKRSAHERLLPGPRIGQQRQM
jgi:hypothetical protein